MVHNCFRTQLEESDKQQSHVDNGMMIAIGKKRAALEQIANALIVIAHSLTSTVWSFNDEKAHEISSNVAGLKCNVRPFHFCVCQNVVDSNDDLFECVSADIVMNWF